MDGLFGGYSVDVSVFCVVLCRLSCQGFSFSYLSIVGAFGGFLYFVFLFDFFGTSGILTIYVVAILDFI